MGNSNSPRRPRSKAHSPPHGRVWPCCLQYKQRPRCVRRIRPSRRSRPHSGLFTVHSPLSAPFQTPPRFRPPLLHTRPLGASESALVEESAALGRSPGAPPRRRLTPGLLARAVRRPVPLRVHTVFPVQPGRGSLLSCASRRPHSPPGRRWRRTGPHCAVPIRRQPD